MFKNLVEKYNPLVWLSALGAGGIAIGAFIILQYTIWTGKGLAHIGAVSQTGMVQTLEGIMILFGSIHFVLTLVYAVAHFKWRKTEKYQEYKENPLVNAGLMAPMVSLGMSLNVMIGAVRYFSDYLAMHLQDLMLPGFVAFAILWFVIVNEEIILLSKSFKKGFDIDKIHFGWLTHPFALGMITVTGTGLAAMAHTEWIHTVSAFMSLISGTMGMFLMSVKLFSIFDRHFKKDGALEYQFMPTYIIVIPIITVFAIAFFRLGHFAEHVMHAKNIAVLMKFGMVTAFAFEVWYFWFGLVMLKDYWREYFKNHFHVSQWGLICPFVGFTALGGFVFKLFAPYTAFQYFIFGNLIFVAILYLVLLKRQTKCLAGKSDQKVVCD